MISKFYELVKFKRDLKKLRNYIEKTAIAYSVSYASVDEIENGINPSDKVIVEIKYTSGEIKKIETLCRIDTKNELEYYKNGGIIQYVLRNMI